MKDDKPNRNSPNSQRMMQGKVLAANTGYRLLNVVVIFLINILLSRLAGVAGYGLLSLLIANAGIFSLLSAFGADAGLTYHAASGRLSPSKLLYFLLVIVLFQVLALAITELTSWFITGHFFLFKTSNFQYWWMGPVFLFSISLVEKYSALLQGQQLFIRCSKAILFSNGLMLALFTVLYFSNTQHQVEYYIAAYVLFNLLQAIFLIISHHVISKNKWHAERPARQDVAVFFSYSMLAFVINIVQFLAYRVDYWLLDHYRGEEELGWYSLAVRLVQLFWVLPLLFAGIIFPVVAKNVSSYDASKMQALMRGMNLLNLFAGIVAFTAVPFLLPFLFGREYENSVQLFQLLLPGIILFCMATLLAAYFAGQKKLKINLLASLLCLSVILVLDFLLIPSYGMKGAAIASSIGYGITAVYYIIMYCYSSGVRAVKLFIPEKTDWNYIRTIFQSSSSKEQ